MDFPCRFNWGLSVRKLAERILELLLSEQLLTEERERARKLTREIKGFGSFSQLRRSSVDESFEDWPRRTYRRSNSNYDNYLKHRDKFLELNQSLLIEERNEQVQESNKDVSSVSAKPTKSSNFWVVRELGDEYNVIAENHPLCDNDHERETKTSLLTDTD